ncbi:hypothetical protein EI94DRAFT_1709621 [Lactarius quietus]|nr:hypothetical protein EI94DRAFT_1709621 [Lactarius quietus]
MSSSPPPHLVYTCWASADEWRPGFVMLGANVCSIPVPPPFSEPVIGIDGFWGAHKWTDYLQPYHREFPYLAWIPLPQRSRSILLAALEESFNDISSEAVFSSVEWPMKAYTRAFEALGELKKDFRAWGDFVAWKDVHAGTSFQSPIRVPTCGAIFKDEQLYADHARWSSASYLLIHKPTFVLDCTKEVQLSPRDLCSAQPLSLQPLVHSLHHWYYPPLVDNVVADLEIAARSYLKRSDLFRPTREFKHKLDKVENKKNEEENQRIFYFHFLLLRREIREQCTRDLPSLTTSKWRSILGNTYWKKCWPSRDNPSLDTTFEPNLFWKHGGPLFFGDTWSVDVAAGLHDPSSLLPCRCDVQITTADDPEIHQVILYCLNSYHVYEEVKEMEHLQFKTTFEKRWGSQEMAVNHITEMWDPSGGGTDFKFFHNKKAWRTWLWAVREVVMDWEGFDSWDWMRDRGLASYIMVIWEPKCVRNFTYLSSSHGSLLSCSLDLCHTLLMTPLTSNLDIAAWVARSLGSYHALSLSLSFFPYNTLHEQPWPAFGLVLYCFQATPAVADLQWGEPSSEAFATNAHIAGSSVTVIRNAGQGRSNRPVLRQVLVVEQSSPSVFVKVNIVIAFACANSVSNFYSVFFFMLEAMELCSCHLPPLLPYDGLRLPPPAVEDSQWGELHSEAFGTDVHVA